MAEQTFVLKAADGAALLSMGKAICKQGLSVINERTGGPSGDGSDAFTEVFVDNEATPAQISKGVQIVLQELAQRLELNWRRNEAARAAADAVVPSGEVDTSLG